MEVSREDLLKQKAALEAQLKWVNSLLDHPSAQPSPASPPSEHSGIAGASAPSSATTVPPSASTASTPKASVETRTATPGQAEQSLPSPGIGTTTPPTTPEAPQANFSAGQKIGCIAVGIGICLGIVFAIFVLPYLLY